QELSSVGKFQYRHSVFGPFHSITSSAVICMISGTVRPSALAVLRLIARSSLAGCSTGKSAGLVPRRILGTSNNIRFRRFLLLSVQFERSCQDESPIGDAWRTTARSFCTTPHGVHP